MEKLPVMPSLRLDGRRVLVTGASRGIGFAAAAGLADAGAKVTLVARSQADLEAAAATIAQAGHEVETLPLDITDTAAMRHALGALDPFDVLVNAAGCNRPRTFLEVSEADYDAVLDLNLRAAFFVMQTVASAMVAAGREGSIIQISSQMGHVGGALRTAYCASKWGLEGLVQGPAAIDLGPHRIRVNGSARPSSRPPMTRPIPGGPILCDHVLSKIKLGRLGGSRPDGRHRLPRLRRFGPDDGRPTVMSTAAGPPVKEQVMQHSGHIAVVGAGLVGSGWAIVFARAGHQVRIFDADEATRRSAVSRAGTALVAMARHGLVSDATDILSRLKVVDTLADAVDGAVYVQGSAFERVGPKTDVSLAIDTHLAPGAIVGSSTSGLPASSFTADCRNRGRFLVAHPVNPPHLVPVVELVPAPWTEPDAVQGARALM